MTPRRAIKQLATLLDPEFFAALAEPSRLAVIRVLLERGPADIGEIAEALPQDRSVISRHLQVLRSARVVQVEKQSRRRIYSLAGAALIERLETMAEAARTAVEICCPTEPVGKKRGAS